MDLKKEIAKPSDPRSIFVNAKRSDISKIELVKKDLVISLKSGRKLLLKDVTLVAGEDPDFRLVFSNNEVLTGQELFAEVQITGEASEPLWLEIKPEALGEASKVASAETGLSGAQIGLVALGLAALGGGGGGGGGGSNGNGSNTTPLTAAETAFQSIRSFADANASATPPTLATYTLAGIQGVSAGNLAAVNDALATGTVTGTTINTTAKLQFLVNAYQAVFALADGTTNNASNSQKLSIVQLVAIGVDTGPIQTGSNSANRLALLNSVMDAKNAADIDTVAKLQNIVKIVGALEDHALGNLPSYNLTTDDFATIGIRGVNTGNLSTLLANLKLVSIDSLEALQQIAYQALTVTFTAIHSDTGFNTADFITQDNTLTFSGASNAAEGSVIQVVLNAATHPVVFYTTVSHGVWQVADSTELSDGVYTVDVHLLDANQKVISSSAQGSVTVATSGSTPLVGPDGSSLLDKTIVLTAISPDNGLDTTDFKTSATQLVLSGTSNAPDGTHVLINMDDVLHYTVVNHGVWSFDNTAQTLSSGSHRVQVSLTDGAGNIAVSSSMQEVVVLSSTLNVVSKTTGAISQTANLSLVFNDSVTAVAGKYISLVDESTNTVLETIEVTDTNRVSINGKEVTINPVHDLVIPNTYHALVDSGAFLSSSGMSSVGISGVSDWIFHPVDPATSVMISGTGVDASNGINANELTHLTVSGTVVSPNMGVVSNLTIRKISFVSTDGLSLVDVPDAGLPTIDPTTHVWTWAHDSTVTSQLVSGKSYNIKVLLQSQVSGTPTQSVAQSANTYLDAILPVLQTARIDTTTLNIGQSAAYTLTFSEDPSDSLSVNDFLFINGTIDFVSTTGLIRQVVFTPSPNVTQAGVTALQLRPSSFTDTVGNVGSIDAGVTWPSLTIDTQAPTVTEVTMSGVNGRTGADKLGTLNLGDKIRVTLTTSEAVMVSGAPSFKVDVGGLSKTLTYVRGSGTTALVFEYEVLAGDLDTVGGLTAFANALALNGGHLKDAAGNDAVVATPAIFSNSNTLVVDGGASDAAKRAAQLIQTFADSNTDPSQTVGVAPTLQDYLDAGVTGMSADKVALINNVLAGANVRSVEVDTLYELQVLVNAYNGLLDLGDGVDNTPTANNPGFAQYGLLGITGVRNNTHAALLGDVIDTKNKTDIDTVPKLQAMADAVSAVLDAAKGVSGLSATQLNLLGLSNVTDDNLPAVFRAISNTADNGTGVDTWTELQNVVNVAVINATQALAIIVDFAEQNTAALSPTTAGYVGTTPTLTTYLNAGVSGITASQLGAINDALATQPVDGAHVSTTAKLQEVADAYLAVIGLADGFGNTSSHTSVLASQYTQLGVSGLDPNASATAHKITLLNDVIDRKVYADIDTVFEMQTLLDGVSILLDTAAGGNALTLAQLSALGFDNVTVNTLPDVIAAIQATATDGSDVDTFAKLSAVISNRLVSIQNALNVISQFAQANVLPAPHISSGVAPTLDDYAAAGVHGVTASNLALINDALATSTVNEASVNTTLEIQALVDAYTLVVRAANGLETQGVIKPSALQYSLLGLTGIDPAISDSTSRSNLLGDVIDRKFLADIDTVSEIQTLLNAVNNVLNAANGIAGLTQSQLTSLGITGVTLDNWALVLKAIGDSPDDGTQVNTLSGLQTLVTNTVNQAQAALQVIQNYAENNTQANLSLGIVPTLQNYVDAGVQGVTADNLGAINSALATATVNAARVGSISNTQDVVNAYLNVFSVADGLDNINNAANIRSEYALIGVTGVDSASKYSLLGDVLDIKNASEVNTTVKIQTMADAVEAVIRAAAGGTDLTMAQLQLLTITGLTADNFPLVLKTLNNITTTGALYDELYELQNLVTTVVNASAAALQTIQIYADSNTASAPVVPSGIAPTKSTYTDAGVAGVTDSNLSSINDALTTSSVISSCVNTTTKVQGMVDAYNAVFTLADGVATNATVSQALSFDQLEKLGVDTIAIKSASNPSTRLGLLNNLIDGQSATGIDTVNEINQLIRIVNAIQDQSAGVTPTYTLMANDFSLIGISGVTSSNLSGFMRAIERSTDDGLQANTQTKLQQLFNNALSLDFVSISADTGISGNDFITNDNTLTFTGTSNAKDDSVVKLTLTPSVGAAITFSTTVNNGAWQVVYASLLNDGVYSVSTQLLDNNAVAIRSATPQTLTIDTSATLLPDGSNDTTVAGQTIDFTAISPDTGVSATDFKTSASVLVFSGTSTAADGAHVALSIDGVMNYTTVTNGIWRFDNTINLPLVSGLHKVKASLIDPAGNVVASSAMRDVVVDDSTLTVNSKTTGAIAQTANLELTFSDSVTARSSKYITLFDSSTQQAFETIEAIDPRITIVGNTVTINPTNDLVLGKNYYATIDRGAFVSSSGMLYNGLLNITDWTFHPVDPSTTVLFGGVGVDASNGINATELANLTVTGTVSSTNGLLVTNIQITKITFTPSGGGAPVVLTTGMPAVDSNTRVWTLANNNSWTSQLVSGKNYIVSAQLEADIAGSHGVSVANSATSLVDAVAPTLVIDNGVTSLKSGQSTLLTFTFSEPPTGFTQSDIVLPTTGGNPIGTLSGFAVTADPSVYTVLFTPASGIALNTSLASVLRTNYTDTVGNIGAANVNSSSVTIDTQVPTVTAMTISGVDSNNNSKLADLQVGDKIKVSLTMSEATVVTGTPIVNIVVGSSTKTASYASGSGSTTLVFYYTVALGDTDNTGGITSLTNALALNGGVLRDAIGNDAALGIAAIVSGTNTVVVETNANALATLADAAQNNSATTLIAPITLFARAGVTGVDLSNLSAVISALDSAAVTATQADTTAKLQNIVDAYKAVLVLADGGQNTTAQVTAGQFETLGVTGVNTTTAGATSVPSTYKASLLSNVVDGLASVAVDSVPELQALANAVTAVMVTANGTVSGASAVTKAQLDGMGITGVTDNNLADVLAAIANTPDNGSSVNTLPALQYVVNLGVNSASQSALTTISNFAADNTSSQPISGAFAYQGTVPTLRDYANAGVTGIDNNNLASVNDALATNVVDRAAVSDAAGIQAVINAYNAVFVLADGNANAGTALTALQLTKVGATIGNAATVATNLTLLNEVLDRQASSAVDRVAEINYLASVTNAIQDSVGNLSASSALGATDFSAIGLNNVTGANLIGIRGSIAAQSAGNKVDSLSELQSLIDFYALAPLSIALVTDTGRSNSDAVTSNLSLSFGVVSAGATRYYSVDSSTYATTYTAPSTQGQHTVAIRQVSALGYLGQTNALSFTYDSIAPVGWDINTTLAGTQSIDQTYFNKNNVAAGKAVDANMGLASEADIATVTVSIAGAALDAVNDRLLFGNITQSLNGVAISGTNQTIGTVTGVDWSYSASNVLTLTKNGGGVFSALDVQKMESAIAFKTIASASQGNRTFTFTHTDLAGNVGASVVQTVTVDTNLNAVDLVNGGPVDATETSYYIAINSGAGKAIAPNMGLPTDTDITSITVAVGGVSDTTNDKFVFGTITQTLNTLPVSGQLQTIGTVAGVDWSYSAGKVLTFTKNAGGAFTAAQVQAIEKALQFQTSTNATQGARSFVFGHTDAAGNLSGTATETVIVETVAPSAIDLISGGPVNATETSTYNTSNAGVGKAITASMGLTADTDITSITVTVGGAVADTTNDKLLFGTVTQTLNTTATSGTNLTIGGVTGVDWSYSAGKVLTLTKNAGGAFTALEVQTIEKALQFQTSIGATTGNRTFTFAHTDAAGNVGTPATETLIVDTVAPSAIDLISGGPVNATETSTYNVSNAGVGKAIVTSMGLTADTDITSITVTVGGAVADTTNDKLLFGTVTQTLNTTATSGTNLTIGGVTGVDWSYSAGKVLILTKNAGGAFTAVEVQTIEKALQFQTSIGATTGNRTFAFAHADAAGNVGTPATETVTVDTVAPNAVDLISGSGVDATETSYYGLSNAGTSKAIAASMALSTDTDIAKITLSVGGAVADTTNDKLLFGTVTQTLNTTATSGTNVTIGGVTGVDWSYSAGKVLTLTKNAGGVFAAADVQTIEKALLFRTSSGATQGNRTFSFGHVDALGNLSTTATETMVVDFLAPVVLLDGTNANRAVSNIATPASATSIDNDANPASVTELNGISKLQLRVSGVRDGTNEKLVINGVDATPLPGNTGTSTVGTLTWSWVFANGTFSFTPSNSAIATSAQAAALLQALSYRDAAVTTSAGVREFFISATDASGNTSAESVATMVINDGLTPQLLGAHPIVALDGNNDGIKGDQFVLTFSEAVKTSLITISALSLDNGKTWGASPSVTPIDAHTVGGTEYATSFLVNGGVNPTYNFAPNQSVLAFNNIPGYATISDSIRVTAHITIETWAYITAFPAINNVVPRFVDLSIGGAGVQNLRMFYFNDGTLGIGYSDEGSAGNQYKGSYITSPGELSTGKWFHVAATIDSNANVVFYINGNVVSGTKGLNDSLWAVWGTEFGPGKTFIYNYVGHSAYGDGNFYGALSDLRIYDSARTASQVTSDMLGNFDTTSLQAAYLLNGNGSSGLAGKSPLVSTAVQGQAPAYGTLANTITINSTNVEDITGNKAAVAQTALFKFNDTQLSGTKVGNNITGTAGNDYLAGYGGNDTLTGDPVGGSVRGADTFAWLRGDTGTDTVTDFMASDGDMISLAGILWSKGLSSSSDELSLARFLNVSQSNTSDAVLKIDVDGLGSFAAGVEKTITFTNGWNTGLNDTLVNLVAKKTLVVDYTVRATPLVLDLNGDGVQTNAVNQGVAFDIQGTGQLNKTGWTDGHDGLLALDLNHDGIINNGTELFGSGTLLADGSQASDGFAALTAYDINQDNVIDSEDTVFTTLKVWIDADVDGKSTATELHSLMDLGVQSINLSAVTGNTQNNGNLFSLVSQWTSTDGQKHDLVDVLFNTHSLNTQEAMVALASFSVDLQTQPDGANYQLHLSDVLANSQQTCLITGNTTQQVTFDSIGWTNTQQTATMGQHTYVLWQNGTANLLVDQQISTHAVL